MCIYLFLFCINNNLSKSVEGNYAVGLPNVLLLFEQFPFSGVKNYNNIQSKTTVKFDPVKYRTSIFIIITIVLFSHQTVRLFKRLKFISKNAVHCMISLLTINHVLKTNFYS